MRLASAITLITMLGACGSANLDKAGSRLGVLAGATDPTLGGTFRLRDSSAAAGGMLDLLILKTDSTFYARQIVPCSSTPCRGVYEVEGTYRQVRELPNLTRASSIVLGGTYEGPDGPAEMTMSLKRAWIEGSPLISLYHLAEGQEADAIPFFDLHHLEEHWCRTPDDCSMQSVDGETDFACEQGRCF